ncbi:MAG: hypothetical protein ACRDV9_13970, partial [Acidimicrobiia bacterium]
MRTAMGAAIVAAGLGGLVLLVSTFGASRRGLLAARLRPYLGPPDPDSAYPGRTTRSATSTLGRRSPRRLIGFAGVIVGLGPIWRASARTGLLVTLAAGLVVATWPAWRRAREDRRRRDDVLAELPTFVDLVGLALAAGEGVRGSLELVAGIEGGPVVEEVRRALRRARVGDPLAESLQE